MALDFYLQIEDANGNILGDGPITSASVFETTRRMDRAGSFSFAMPAADPKAALISKKRVARAYAPVGDVWMELGAGIIDHIERRPDANGIITLAVSGDDLLRELANKSVHRLEVNDTLEVVTGVVDNFATGWTVTPDTLAPVPGVYARFAGDSVLTAFRRLAEAAYTHFYYAGARDLVFTHTWTDSGVRAIQAQGALASETCAITELEIIEDSYDLVNYVIPFGAGQGEARLSILPSTRTASLIDSYVYNGRSYGVDKIPTTNPAGFIYLADSITNYGLIQRYVEFKEIGPVSNTDADVEAASNALFDAAIRYMDQRADEQTFYRITINGCSQILRPLQTIRVIYRDPDAGLDIDEDLYILESTFAIDRNGIQTTQLTVSTIDRYPDGDIEQQAAEIATGEVYRAYPQLNANSYVLPFSKPVDEDNSAVFRFRFGPEVAQLQQVTFEFQLLPLESTVKSVGAVTVTSTEGGGTVGTSGDGGGTTVSSTSGGSSTPTSSSGGGASLTSASGGSSTPTSSSGGGTTVSSTSGGSSTPTSTSGGGTTATSTSGGGDTVTSASGGSSSPTSYSANAFHGHEFTIVSGSSGNAVTFNSGTNTLYSSTGGTVGVDATNATHTHDVDVPAHDHGVTILDHDHDVTIPNHTHDVSIAGHTHDVTVGNHSHTVTISGHTHGVTISAHTHTVTISGHTHDVTLSNHNHSLTIPDHTHDLTPDITTVYGIFRDDPGGVWLSSELQYRVNSGSWVQLSTATSLGSGWYQVDLTDDLQDSNSFRPLQTSNTFEIRKDPTVIPNKLATIDAQLSIRNIIQAIAYT